MCVLCMYFFHSVQVREEERREEKLSHLGNLSIIVLIHRFENII